MTPFAIRVAAASVLLASFAVWSPGIWAQAAPASPAAVVSQYTTLDLKACKRVASDRDGGRWSCGGPKGFEVLFAEGDLRQFIAYGAKAREQRASTQTLAPFNSIFKDTTDRAVIEWRGELAGAKFAPFATIVRFHTDTGDSGDGNRRRGQVLVVSKLGAASGQDACHVAYVDALANKDANVLAKKAADELARGFDCRKEPVVTGEKGAIPPVRPTRI